MKRTFAATSIGMLILTLANISSTMAVETVLSCDFKAQKKALRDPGPALIAEIPQTMTAIPLNAVQITDRRIAKKIIVQGLFARRTQTDTVEVVARLVNCTDYPQQLQLRSSFMDSSQLPVEPTSTWSRVFIPPRSTGTYSEKSISTFEVEYYLVEMVEGD